VIAVERALPEIVVLLLLVAALGVGPFPGVVTLAIGSVDARRLFADAIEEIDARVIESVACVGASRWQVVRYAVLPEVMPSFLADAIFPFRDQPARIRAARSGWRRRDRAGAAESHGSA
jgi:phosphonate transport system permease protein